MKKVIAIGLIIVAFGSCIALADTPQEIMARYIEALGGEQPLRAIKTLEFESEADHPNMPPAKFKMYMQQEGNKRLMVLIRNGNEIPMQGSVGLASWHLTQHGMELIPEEQSKLASIDYVIGPPLEYMNNMWQL